MHELWLCGFELLRGSLCCVLGQDTLLSQRLSPPRRIITNLVLGVTLTWTSIASNGGEVGGGGGGGGGSSRKSRNTSGRFALLKPA